MTQADDRQPASHVLPWPDVGQAKRHRFVLTDDQWKEFLAALEAPPLDLPRLRRLLSEPSFFDDTEGGGPRPR